MQDSRPLYYVATMIPKDAEDNLRIRMHQQEREGWGFETVEVSGSFANALKDCDPKGVFLLDSVTALLENEMFPPDGSMNLTAHEHLAEELVAAVQNLHNIVIVSDYIYSDALRYGDTVEAYKKNLAYIDRRLAEVCDVVLEGCSGQVLVHKGEELFRGLPS